MNILTGKKASATGNHRLDEGNKKGLVLYRISADLQSWSGARTW